MMVFDNFVFVHLPKTGGTFVETVLKRLHCASHLGQKIHAMQRRIGVTLPLYPYRYREYRKHAQCKFIPAADRDKTILSCVRNPYDLYISHYTFGWWRSHPETWFAPGSAMLERARSSPGSISFADWVLGCRDDARWVHYKRATHPNHDLGWASCEFVSYFCRRPEHVLDARDDVEEMARRFKAHAFDVHFLRMNALNEGLYRFLLERGYSDDRIGFIRSAPRIYPGRVTRDAGDTVDKRFTQELRAEVRHRERLLFALFPELEA
jgi:hypothetical protein